MTLKEAINQWHKEAHGVSLPEEGWNMIGRTWEPKYQEVMRELLSVDSPQEVARIDKILTALLGVVGRG